MARPAHPVLAVCLGLLLAAGTARALGATTSRPGPALVPGSACRLANGIGHVIYLEFDNVHLSRDQPGVPSDLEQMPHLLAYLERHGTIAGQTHTPLISHTAGDIVASLTGLYPDRQGQAVSNSYRFFNPDGSLGSASSFTYWTGRVTDARAARPSDLAYNLAGAGGANVPAPWAPFTRAGCNVGSAGGPAGLSLENTGADLTTVFGPGSPALEEARLDPGRAAADFEGVSVHCALGSPLCATGNGGRPDRLASEPGGYEGYAALFGHRHVAPRIAAEGMLHDLGGRPLPGFPGFDAMTPDVSLAYVAAMQEHGIPVTYAYLSDAHDPRGPLAGDRAFGPGEPGYVRQLKAFDDGFARFFDRLARAGLDQSNTLLVVAADENDHFVGERPSPAGCDGVRTPCSYRRTGEIAVNLTGLLAREGVAQAFAAHDDSAPAIWVNGDPGPGSPALRNLERAAGRLVADNPYTGVAEPITHYIADRPALRMLHMVTSDPARTPSFVVFAHPDYYLFAGSPGCGGAGCSAVDSRHAYNHGDVDPDITTTWFAVAGPGTARRGIDRATWVEETDIRPTLMALTGLQDAYDHDGKVVPGLLQEAALPAPVRAGRATFESLADHLQQIDAPVGRLGLLVLDASTRAVGSVSTGDAAYIAYTVRLADLGARRDALAARIRGALAGAAFARRPLDPVTAARLAGEADRLLAEAAGL